MKELPSFCLLGLLLIFYNSSYAQDTLSAVKPSQFAVVTETYYFKTGTHWVVDYSNGSKENLDDVLNIGNLSGISYTTRELKILDYFFKKDYQMIGMISITANVRYYYYQHK